MFNDATGANEITLKNHNLTTGDKIIYYSTHYAVGLGNSSYYVSVIDDNTFKLCQTYQNAINNPPGEIDITAAQESPQFIDYPKLILHLNQSKIMI